MRTRPSLWSLPFLESALKDTAFALRQLRNAPGFTAVAVLSLALGIGANTAIFTIIESTLLRPIAVPHPESLRLLTWKTQPHGWVAANIGSLSPTFGTGYEQRPTPDGGLIHTSFAPRMYESFRRNSNVFASLFAFKEFGSLTTVIDGSAEAVNCFLVSGDFYRGMEITPVIGRPISPDDDVRTQAGSVVLISYQYWTRRFARSPSVIGKRIILNAAPVTIIGVNPEYFTGIEPGAHFEIWAPLNLPQAFQGRILHGAEFTPQSTPSLLDDDRSFILPMMGRLKPGVSDSRTQSVLDALFQTQVDADPGPLASFLKLPAKRPRLLLQSAARGVDYLTERYDRLLLAVLALSGLVLLIACVNVANLLLAKSAVRQREISLRLALGASRWRIARQLLAEGLLLAAMAGVAGVIFGYAARNMIPALLSAPWRPNPFDTAFDPRVLLVSLGVTFLTGVLFSLAPMWQSRRVEVNDALKEGSRGSASLSKLRIGRLLVVMQVALSIFLLVGAGLCVKTFTNLRNIPLGFEPRNVLLFTLDPPRLTYSSGRMTDLLTQLQLRLSTVPGVQSVAFTGSRGGTGVGRGPETPVQTYSTWAFSLELGSRFFETMGIRILYGRAVDEHDRSEGLHAVVVNEEFAHHFFPAENPVGKTFRGSNDLTYQIIGVCADWRVEQFRDPVRPTFYSAWMQDPHSGSVQFEIKIAGEQGGIVRQIRDTVRAIDSNLVVTDVHTELEQIESALSQERLMASLAAIFGALALLLATIGIYGVMAYAVARRTNEIGIRIALGAQPGGVARMVLRETLTLAALGVAIGAPAVLAATPVLDHFLAPGWREGVTDSFAYGLKPDDPFLLVLAALVLISGALFAGYLPARRAARIDPMAALRHD
jgi:predicted permease